MKIKNILKNYNKDIIFSKYINSNIMYLYIMDYKTEDKTILIKIGYTSDLLEREKTLITEYSCNFYPVGFQHIHSEQDEKKFHKLIRNVYPHLINNLKINNKIKKEIYKYDEVLISEFLNYHLKLNNLLLIEQEKTIQEKEKTKQIEITEIEKTKQEELKLKQIEITEIEKTKQEKEKTKQEELKLKQLELSIKLELIKSST